jgi:hypothetical protein
MSNQHDNIYNILGKLDALTPKQAPVEPTPAKTINESVEARGSVLAGVAKVEARLAQQFAEANDWNKLGAEFRSTKPGTREPTHTGEKEYTKTGVRHHASKRYGGDRADDAETVNSTGEKRGRGRPKKSQFEGDESESNIRDTLAYEIRMILDGALADNDQTDHIIDELGDIFNDIEASGDREAMMAYEMMVDTIDTDADTQVDAARQALKLLNLDEGDMEEAYVMNPNQAWNYGDKAGMDAEKKYDDEYNLYKTPGADPKLAQQGFTRAQAVHDRLHKTLKQKPGVAEEQLDELSPETVNKVNQARQQQAVTAEKGYLDLAQQRQQDAMASAKAANPSISNNDLSKIRPQIQPQDQATVDAHNAAQKKLRANTMLGNKVGYSSYDKNGDPTGMQNQNRYKVGESINFAEMMKEQHQTVDEYLAELNADIAEFKKSGHMSGKLRDSLEMHKFSKKQLTDEGGSYLNYADSAAENPAPREKPVAVVAPAPKPQGIMGRMGSAIAGGVKSAAGAVNRVVGHPSDAEMLDRLKKDTMKEELDELARLAGLSESLKGGQKKLDKNKNGELDSDDFKKLRDKVSEATVDEDMIKSKKDDDKKEDDMEEGAGVMHFKAQQAKADGKDSFKLGDKEYPVKEGMAAMTEADLGNVAGYYKETQDVKKLTTWLEKNAGLPRNSPLYFDDVDLVYGDKTIVPGALVNPKLTFNDLLTAVVQALKQGSTEAKEGQLNELSPELLKRARDAAGMKYAHADDRKDQKASEKYSRLDDKFNSALRKKEKVDECGPEMSPFSSMGHAEAESGMSINSSMDTKTGRKTLSVTADGEAAEQLAQMLKMAGMGGQSQEPRAVVVTTGPEEAVEEEREGQYANTPDEEVENIDAIMHQGNDLNREKEQYANRPKAGDNPMATREGIEMPKSLSRMLEAIKMVEAEKCNHTAKGKKCPVHGMKECSYMEEAAKYRDPKYKDKLYTQEPPDYNDTREYDNAMWNPKPDDYPGRKELPGGGEYDRTDPLVKGYGRGGTGSLNTHGKRKGLPSRDQVSSLKGSIKAAHGTHPRPNLPEAKPSAGMSKGEKSSLVKKAKAGGDIGKPGKSFDKVAKAAGGGEKGKKIAAAAMWKNAAK